MKRACRALVLFSLSWVCGFSLCAQQQKVQNKPYLDMRRLHYGFLFGFQMMDLELRNNGHVDPGTGEQWYADVDNYSPGFCVGVLGELRLNRFFSLRLSPTIQFGQKHISFHEQLSGRDSTQNIKSTLLMLPLDVKFAAPRHNNFRPYLIAGAAPMVDFTARKHHALRMKPFDLCLEVGMGCDIYLPYFKLIPELKFCFGLLDVLQKNRSDLIDGSLTKFTPALDRARSKMIVLTLNFE